MNAHIDTVPADPIDEWHHNPWGADIEGDRLYGRGACDMKSGAAAIIAALEAIREAKVMLKGDVILQFVLDEELNGMGTAACVRRGYRGDAGIIPEPTNAAIWIARRGLLYGKLTVRGRSGHAEFRQPHWLEGGAVNAIDKMELLIQALKELEVDWQGRPDKKHKYLSSPKIVRTMINGGQFTCTYPERCELVFDATYIKANADNTGWGSVVKEEIEDQIRRACDVDPWLREHRPTLSWTQAFPPSEVDEQEPIIQTLRSAAQDAVGFTPEFQGNDASDDCSYLITMGGFPSVCFGPGPTRAAHEIDEYVSIESMVKVTKVLALCVTRWCGSTW